MSTIHVDVSPEMLDWILQQINEGEFKNDLVPEIEKWKDGTDEPTFSQIESISRKTHIPLGYFFLRFPPDEKTDLWENRTIRNAQFKKPSRNLIDTIYDMENIQDWMRAYRQESGFEELSVAGSAKVGEGAAAIANRIRKDLELTDVSYETSKGKIDSFGFIRKRLQECGIVVMLNDIVGRDEYRVLNIEEFRSFAMADKWAPLIFINTADSDFGKLFSLLHETVYIWLGKDDLFNDNVISSENISKTEILCNSVVRELLSSWEISLDKLKEPDCPCSTNNRLDASLVLSLCESILMGRTTFTEAYRLTNTTGETFSEAAKLYGADCCV